MPCKHVKRVRTSLKMFSVSRKFLKQVKNITRRTSKSGPILCRSIYCCIFWGLAMTFNDAFASVKLCNVLEFIDGSGTVMKKMLSRTLKYFA